MAVPPGILHVMTSEQLRAWVRDDFGVDLESVERIHHGADTAAEVWRGITPTDRLYAVKWSGGGSDAGPLVSAYLAEHGVPGVAGPAKTRGGRLWSTREGRRLSLLPWISAARAVDANITAQHWTAYGELLASVHATAPSPELAAALRRENYDHERMVTLAETIDHRLRTDKPRDRLEEELAAEWNASRELITGLIYLAEDLAQELRGRDATKVICHSDPHLGNLLLGPGDEVWLIDWDDVMLAPRERDLMFLLGGMGSVGPVSEQRRTWFFNGYGTAEIDEQRLTYYRCARALDDAAQWAEQVLQGPDREEALTILRGVLSPSGLAVLALSDT